MERGVSQGHSSGLSRFGSRQQFPRSLTSPTLGCLIILACGAPASVVNARVFQAQRIYRGGGALEAAKCWGSFARAGRLRSPVDESRGRGHRPGSVGRAPTGAPQTTRIPRRPLRWLSFILVGLVLAGPLAAQDSELDAIRGQLRAGRYPEAERRAHELLKATERLHGADSRDAADVLDLIAEAMRRGGRSAEPEALSICLRALQLKEKFLPPYDPSLAISLENLGALYVANGDLSSARRPLERALESRTRTLGPSHPDVARSLLYLGNLEFSAAHDEVARGLVERAIEIQESALSPEDPARAEALNMLAGIHYERGEYREAGSVYERVLSLQTRTLGNDHPYTTSTLQNLGALATEMGDYSEARWYLEHALSTMRRVLRPGHPLIARTLVALAIVLERVGDREKARAYYLQALAIQKKAFGPDHVDVGWTLMRLGRLEIDRGRYEPARRALVQALRIQQDKLSADHPDLAWTLAALASADAHQGFLDEASERFNRALAIQEETLGPGHPDVAPTLAVGARIRAQRGDSGVALEMALRGARIRAEHLLLTSGGLSERQAMAYAAVGPTGLDAALELIASPGARASSAAVRQVWNAVLQTRTLVLDEVAGRHRAALADSVDAETRTANETLRGSRQRLANLLVRGPGDELPHRYHALVRRARLDMERAERDLGARSAAFRVEQAEARSGLEEVLAAVPPKWGLVAYATFASTTGRRYVAFVRGASGEPVAIPIGDANRVEALVQRWAHDVLSGVDEKGPSARKSEAACRSSGEALRWVIWDPVLRAIGRVESVLVVPDGILHSVNFGALPAAGDQYLVEGDLLIHYVSSERDLVSLRGTRAHGSGLLAIGGVEFGPVSAPVGRVPARQGRPDRVAVAATDVDCVGFRDVKFTPLPQSRLEVEEIGAVWGDPNQVTVVTGPLATEEAFKRLAPGKRVLHLATHGFVLDPDQCLPAENGMRGIGGLESTVRPRLRPSFNQQSPLLLSGLALAAANRRSEATPREEDGILAAEEVATLDLRGVDWAVLSACDTGGAVASRGEGILGLRRAFKTAGVSTLVISLWPVDDRAAREWMRAFYRARIQGGATTASAVRAATLEVLRSRKAQGRSTNPFFWAAFLATGDWR